MVHVIQESSSTLRKADGATWKITLITPGKGSSGIYSEEMLKSTAASAFPAGTHSYVDHLKEGDQRNPRDLLGVLAEAATYEDGVGVVGKLKVFPHYTEFVDAVAEHTGMSIFAASEGHKDENGDYIVESLVPNVFNSIDLVSYAGRGGEMTERLLESARAVIDHKDSAPVAERGTASAEGRNPRNKETNGMDEAAIADLSAKVDSLVEGLSALSGVVTTLVEAQAPVEPMVEEAEIDFAQVAEQAVAAGLPAEARKVVYESVRNGKAIDDAIADQKALVESIKQEFISAGAQVRVGESAVSAAPKESFFVGRWDA